VALLVALGVYSFIGTLVPQGRDTAATVRQWDTAHEGLAPLVGVLGLHQAFSSPVFVALAILLACATAVCAWRRTAVARRRSSALRALRRGETAKAAASPTFAIETEADRSEAIDRAESALREAGLGAKRAGDTLVLASNPATVWGSTVFHWALVALLAVVVLSAMVRSDGLIGIPRGESRVDEPASYGVYSRGPLHSTATPPLRIGVEEFEVDYTEPDGTVVGPTATVAVATESGVVLARQRVYPNHPLKYGSMVVHSNSSGLALRFVLERADGSEIGRTSALVDVSDETTSGTTPAVFVLTGPGGQAVVEVEAALEPVAPGSPVREGLPELPRVSLTMTSAEDGAEVASGRVGLAEGVSLPDGSTVRFVSIDHYARLSVVDDWTVPLLYVVLLVAVIGVTIALLGRQRLFVVIVSESGPITVVSVTMRAWRSAGFDRDSLEMVLREGLATSEGGG